MTAISKRMNLFGTMLAAFAGLFTIQGEVLARDANAATRSDVSTQRGSVTGLPIPRFVSLKANSVRFRVGPGRKYPIAWLYKRRGLPVEVIQESDRWRKVRDADGTEGWVLHSLLSGRRTIMLAPWDRTLDDKGRMIDTKVHVVHSSASQHSSPRAHFEAGVIGSLIACGGGWCEVEANAVSGWVPQQSLWGTYPNERIDG